MGVVPDDEGTWKSSSRGMVVPLIDWWGVRVLSSAVAIQVLVIMRLVSCADSLAVSNMAKVAALWVSVLAMVAERSALNLPRIRVLTALATLVMLGLSLSWASVIVLRMAVLVRSDMLVMASPAYREVYWSIIASNLVSSSCFICFCGGADLRFCK